jgi:tetratricopeptide (TPR) repeat protein
MSADYPTLDEQCASLLAAYHEALAAGLASTFRVQEEVPAELRPRLQRNLDCLRLLEQAFQPLAAKTGMGPLDTQAQSPFSQPSDTGVPVSTLGRFEIERELGRGGFGVVFLAYDPKLCREVALKVPRPAVLVSSEAHERFLREARAAAGLDHPNVVPVYEAGEVGPGCYIAAAFCPGVTLAAWLRGQTEPVPWRTAALLVAALADGVEHAHCRGVLHRDLKPANVMLSPLPETGGGAPAKEGLNFVPKILDFGLAKMVGRAEDDQTQTGAILGTPCYMAPEQAGGKSRQVGPAADVYALGTILYEVLTGRPPFQGDSTVDTLLLVRGQEPLPPSRLRPRLPRDLETICLACLHKEPGRRYPSAAALAEDLRRFLAGEPIKARPTPLWERGLMWARRRPAVATLLGLCTAAFLALVVGGLLYNAWLDTARRQAEDRADEAQRQTARANDQEKLARQKAAEALRQEKEAQAQFARAEINLEDATGVVDRMLTRLGDGVLRNLPRTELLRRALLEDALAMYQKFLQQKSTDPGMRHKLAQAHGRVGKIYSDLGQEKKALKAWQEAQDAFQKLVDDVPGEPAYRLGLADAYHDLGFERYKAGKTSEAATALRQSVRLKQKLADDFPKDAGYRQHLAISHNDLGIVLYDQGEQAAAEKAYDEALTIREKLVYDFPKVANYRVDLAASYNNRGLLRQKSGQVAEATKAYRKAITIWQQLVTADKDVPNIRQGLAKSHHNLGRLLKDSKQFPEAEAEFRKAVDLGNGLTRDYPKNVDIRLDLAQSLFYLIGILERNGKHVEAQENGRTAVKLWQQIVQDAPHRPQHRYVLAACHRDLGSALVKTGRAAEAADSYREALGLLQKLSREDARNADYRQWAASARHKLGQAAELLLQQGEHAAAARAAASLAAFASTTGKEQYRAAVLMAGCVSVVKKDAKLTEEKRQELVQVYGGQAVQFLRVAVERGRLNPGQLQKDPSLAPLRTRQDFQKLVN